MTQRTYCPTLALLLLIVICSAVRANEEANAIEFVTQWGEEGSDNGQFHSPIGLAINNTDVVYVTDLNNARLQKFDTNGKYLGSFKLPRDTADRNTSLAAGVTVSNDGLIYVSFMNQHKIRVYNDAGEIVREWGTLGAKPGELNGPGGLLIRDNTIYVADQRNHRIQLFTTDGRFLNTWGVHGSELGQFGGHEAVGSRFGGPHFIAGDSRGRLFATEGAVGRVQRFAGNGSAEIAWGNTSDEPGGFGALETGFSKNAFGPIAVMVDEQDRVWISSLNDRVQAFTPDGKRFWPDDAPFVDPLVGMPAVAAATERVSVYTNVLKTPLRHPLLVAKSIGSIAALFPGRVGLGVGLSWIPEEFTWLGQGKSTRGERLDELVAFRRFNGFVWSTYYAHQSHNDSVSRMVETDSNGQPTVVESYEYDAYGQPTILGPNNAVIGQSNIANPYMFHGRRQDPETGLYYNRLRYYCSRTGRFTRIDPGGNWADPATIGNGYNFGDAAPTFGVDPDGQFFFAVLAIIVVAVKSYDAVDTAVEVAKEVVAVASGEKSVADAAASAAKSVVIGATVGVVGKTVYKAVKKVGRAARGTPAVGEPPRLLHEPPSPSKAPTPAPRGPATGSQSAPRTPPPPGKSPASSPSSSRSRAGTGDGK